MQNLVAAPDKGKRVRFRFYFQGFLAIGTIHMNIRALRADALLLLAAAIWGLAFVAQRMGMEHLGPFSFNGIRFALGSLTLVPLWLAGRGRRDPVREQSGRPGSVLLGSLVAGLLLFCGSSLQQVGLVFTTAGKAGFITGLYVVLVPLLGLFRRQRAGGGAWFGAAAAAAGLYLLSVRQGFTVGAGDSLVFAGAFFWAAHVLTIGHWTRRVNPVELAALQFAVCSALSLLVAALFETTTLDAVHAAAIPLLYGGICSVGIGFTRVPPSPAR